MNDLNFEFPFINHNLSKIKEKILIAVKLRIENMNKSRGIKIFLSKSNDCNIFKDCLEIYYGRYRYTLYMYFRSSNFEFISFELMAGSVGELRPDFHYDLYLNDIGPLFYRILILFNIDLQNDRQVYPTLGNSQDDRLLNYFDDEGNLISSKAMEEIVKARPMSDSVGFDSAFPSLN